MTHYDKCRHGVYIPRGETVALNCSACNPQHDRVLAAAMAIRKPACRIYGEPRTMDASDFMRQNPNDRISAGREFITLGDVL